MTILKVSHLTKTFEGINAVNDCSFSVEENSITGIIGPNGAGKSTIFDLIAGFRQPDSGDILFKGSSILGLSEDERARNGISRMFQKSRLFDYLTVNDNLELAVYKDDTHFWRNLFSDARILSPKIVTDYLDRV